MSEPTTRAPTTDPDAVPWLLEAAVRGEPTAPDRLLPLVYDELRKLAAARLAERASSRGRSLQATELVHEVYLRLVDEPPTGTAFLRTGTTFFAAGGA